jgi:hypothetical protein
MSPGDIFILVALTVGLFFLIAHYSTKKPHNIVVISKDKQIEQKKDADFVDDAILIDMVDEDNNYFEIEE